MGSAERLTREGALTPDPQPLGPSAAWAVLIVSTLARAGLAVLVLLLLWALLPAAFGMRSTVVMTGSMEPAIHVGDVVVTRPVPADQLQLGSVLLVDDPDQAGQLRLHRFVGTQDGLLRLRGDANATIDSSPVRPEAVHGVGFLRVPLVGMPLVWARSGDWVPVGVTAVVLAAMLFGVGAGRQLPEEAVQRRGSRGRGVRGASAAGAVLVLVALCGGHPVPSARAAFSSVSPTPSSTFATDTFPCLSEIGAMAVVPKPTVAYGFAETSGLSTADLTGNGGTGSFSVSSVALVPGSCVQNDRPAVRIGGPALSPVSPGAVTDSAPVSGVAAFTTSVWFKADQSGGVIAGFVSNSDPTKASSVDRQLLLNTDGTITFRVGVALGITGSVTTTVKVENSRWYHLAVTVDSALLSGLGPSKVYLNGVNVASADLSLSLNLGSSYLRLGTDTTQATGSNPFHGALGGTAFWKGAALTPAQVKAISDAGH